MAGVLDGIRVFDLTLAAVGPWASKLLGQLGADVIHVEGPKPELAHNIPPYVRGTGVLYLAANGGKRHVMLDLKDPADRATALRLVEQCDVFVQNMRPGAVDKLGLSYEAVSAVNPGIVYVSASAYGRVGPMATEAGVDPLVQAFCGWCSVNGAPGSSGEMFRHYAHLDLTTSSMAVEAVLAGLLARERTGSGSTSTWPCWPPPCRCRPPAWPSTSPPVPSPRRWARRPPPPCPTRPSEPRTGAGWPWVWWPTTSGPASAGRWGSTTWRLTRG